MGVIANLKVLLTAQTAQYDRALKSSSRSTKQWADGMRTLGKYAAGAFSAYKAYDIVRDSVKAFMESETAVNNLSAAYRVLGVNSNEAVKRAEEFAQSIQKITTVDDEAVLGLMYLGASVGKLSGTQLEQATKAAIGLSKAFKIDLTAAMRLVARAAVGDTAMLKRYGIVIEETLSPTEKLNALIKIGAKNFSLATAEVDTYAGKWQQLVNKMGDAKEVLGELIMRWPSLNEAIFAEDIAGKKEYEERQEALRRIKEIEKEINSPAGRNKDIEYLRRQVELYQDLREALVTARKPSEYASKRDVMYWMRDRQSANIGLEFAQSELKAAEATKKRADAQKYFANVLNGMKIGFGRLAGGASDLATGGLNTIRRMAFLSRKAGIEEMKSEAEAIYEETRTPLEKYQARMKQLDKLYDSQILKLEEYKRAAKLAADELNSMVDAGVVYRSPGQGMAISSMDTAPRGAPGNSQLQSIQREQTSVLKDIRKATQETANKIKAAESGGFTK